MAFCVFLKGGSSIRPDFSQVSGSTFLKTGERFALGDHVAASGQKCLPVPRVLIEIQSSKISGRLPKTRSLNRA